MCIYICQRIEHKPAYTNQGEIEKMNDGWLDG
jgi:hypothetical protein